MYIFSGKVIKGEGRGRVIGVPTANLDNVSLPLNHGVYLVEVYLNNKRSKGLLHFGPKKTFDSRISTEIYIHDFQADIYGKKLKIKIIKKIRKIMKFRNIEELMRRIRKDKEILTNYEL